MAAKVTKMISLSNRDGDRGLAIPYFANPEEIRGVPQIF